MRGRGIRTLSAIGRARERGGDLPVQRFEGGFFRVEEDDFVAVGGGEGEHEGDGRGHGGEVGVRVRCAWTGG